MAFRYWIPSFSVYGTWLIALYLIWNHSKLWYSSDAWLLSPQSKQSTKCTAYVIDRSFLSENPGGSIYFRSSSICLWLRRNLALTSNCELTLCVLLQWGESTKWFLVYRLSIWLYQLSWSVGYIIYLQIHYPDRLNRIHRYFTSWADLMTVLYYSAALGVCAVSAHCRKMNLSENSEYILLLSYCTVHTISHLDNVHDSSNNKRSAVPIPLQYRSLYMLFGLYWYSLHYTSLYWHAIDFSQVYIHHSRLWAYVYYQTQACSVFECHMRVQIQILSSHVPTPSWMNVSNLPIQTFIYKSKPWSSFIVIIQLVLRYRNDENVFDTVIDRSYRKKSSDNVGSISWYIKIGL